MTARCICGCGARAVHRHHAIVESLVKREGGDLRDDRNLVPIAMRCHLNHHARAQTLPLRVLPDSVFVFARELLGAGRAYEALRRSYVGGDARLDALLQDEAA